MSIIDDIRIDNRRVPIYEYRCHECGKRSTSLLPSYSSPDPPCPHCGKPALKRLVSTFATVSSSDADGGDDFDEGGGGDDFGGGEDFGGGGYGGDDDF
jgi:putative FmdB family regulatory protein